MMALAMKEAKIAWGRVSPNPMVGAILVKKGKVISKGYHKFAGAPHAEPMAIDKAGKSARNSTLYVTLEPCNHHGRTPPCTEAILNAGIKRVVVGTLDPTPHAKRNGAGRLKKAGLEVETGVLGKRCEQMNEFYNKHVVTGLPFVILKSAATLDGKLSSVSGDARWITGPKARAYVHRQRDGVDAILVGRGTVDVDNPSLNTRLASGKKGRDPIRIVLDTNLKTNPDAKVFDPSIGGPSIIVCGKDPALARVRKFEKIGVEVLPLPLKKGRPSMKRLLRELGRRNIQSLLIEGGSQINSSALITEKIVDKVLFFFAPKIIGGESAPSMVGGAGILKMADSILLDIVQLKRMGPDFFIEAVPRYK